MVLPQLRENPLVLPVGNGPAEEMLLRPLGLGYQHGESVRAGDAQGLGLQHQSGPPGIIDDIQKPPAPGKMGEVHRGRAGVGEHPHRGGVYDHLRVGVAVQVVIVVRAGAGDHHDLPGAGLTSGGLGGERGPAGSQDHHFFSIQGDPGPMGHIEKAVDVRIIAHQGPIPLADDGVHAADGLSRWVEPVAQGHHVPLVGNGDIQPADVLPPEKGGQL